MKTRKIMTLLIGAAIFFSAALGISSGAQERATGQEKTIAVLGSSVAAGWVTSRTARYDMENGYAQRLGRRLDPRGFKVVNISVPGDTTEKVLARLDKDLFPLNPDFVVISLSLENEGIRGLWGRDSETVYDSFKAGLREIILRCRQNGIVPILGTCYPNDNYVQADHYAFIKKMNAEIGGWDVPSLNLLGALDNGDGQFIPGIAFDPDHPDDRGHRELFHSVVPSLFEALAAGKPAPEKETSPWSLLLGKDGSSPGMLSHVPTDPLHSFTSIIEFYPRSQGVLTSFLDREGAASVLSINSDGRLTYRSTGGDENDLPFPVVERTWLHMGIVHNGLKNETIVYADGMPSQTIPETLCPVQFRVGGSASAAAEFREWMIFRAPLNGDEMKHLRSGRILRSSLEVYAPLREPKLRPDQEAANRAQSLARVVFSPSDADRDIARLRAGWKREDEEEKIFIDPQEKKAVAATPKILEACVGAYEGPPGMILTVERRGTRLFLHLNGGRDGTIELLPLSPERFFVKSPGAEIEVIFGSAKDEAGRSESLVLKINGREIEGKRRSEDDAWPGKFNSPGPLQPERP